MTTILRQLLAALKKSRQLFETSSIGKGSEDLEACKTLMAAMESEETDCAA